MNYQNNKVMEKLVITTEEDLKKIIHDGLEKFFSNRKDNVPEGNTVEDVLLTNLGGIAKLLHCSLPTAQKIKNAIPKDMYLQVGKKFAIKKSILLKSYTNAKI